MCHSHLRDTERTPENPSPLIPRSQVRFLPGALVEGYFSLKAAYEAGAASAPPAAAHGHSYGYVHDAITETDTQLRGLGAEQPRM
ncbi:helix-turn-helix domain-containing protein [Mycobacteroides abscessus]|uniref:helix-turn-helix domain-containing protein n=1 Tax=Mycobacteroides abscessus TaxID=36809 RepID=UPI00355C86B5